MGKYQFTQSWFADMAKKNWDNLIPLIKPQRILEIGSYEGASTCYLIENLTSLSDLEIHCVDSWGGGEEHKSRSIDMESIENRFYHNIQVATAKAVNKVEVVVHKALSDLCLARLLSEGKRSYFDFIYVDGAHHASEVLCDAVLCFRLLKIGGHVAFDDYLWFDGPPEQKDILQCPKPAIDAFVNLYCRKIEILNTMLHQIYFKKISE